VLTVAPLPKPLPQPLPQPLPHWCESVLVVAVIPSADRALASVVAAAKAFSKFSYVQACARFSHFALIGAFHFPTVIVLCCGLYSCWCVSKKSGPKSDRHVTIKSLCLDGSSVDYSAIANVAVRHLRRSSAGLELERSSLAHVCAPD